MISGSTQNCFGRSWRSEDLGLRPGSVLTFIRQPGGDLISRNVQSIADLKGWFQYSGPVRTLEEMDDVLYSRIEQPQRTDDDCTRY